ncbi:MAG: transporter substrate-binding domain-containing protein [Burkholderiaceae bacterium]|nr:transporter substrate-binding domain-containing protein [Roseateles sp.]MBV8470303.1 transporter substrate-binding domain-containing protein [Burkholderiaceae bacterium]
MRVSMMHAPPYIILEPGHAPSGSEPELLEAILVQAGCKVEMLPTLPRRRRRLMFMAGDIDVLMDVEATPERAQYGWLTPPYRSEVVSLFTLASSPAANGVALPSIESFDDLLSHKLRLISQNLGWFGPGYAEALPKLQQAHLFTPYEGVAQGLTMLKAQRGEVLLADRQVALHEAKRLGIELKELPWSPSSTPVRLWLSKKSVSEADAMTISAAVQTLEDRGVLKAIRNRWGVQ